MVTPCDQQSQIANHRLRTTDYGPLTPDSDFFSSHLTLRPVQQPANIGMVHGDDNQRAACRAKNNRQGRVFHEINEERKRRRGDDRTQGNVTPNRHDDGKDDQHQRNLKGSEGNEDSHAGGDAFASAKFQPDGEAVAQNCRDRRRRQSIAGRPREESIAHREVSRDASSTAKIPFPTSRMKVATKPMIPRFRITLVAPVEPLPVLRTSTPFCQRTMRYPKGIEPRR